jgi:hypothetical protein
LADNSTLDPGTGGDSIRDKDRAGVKTQIVGLDLGIGTGTESLMSGVMPVSDNSGSLTVDNGGTFAVQDSQKIVDNAGFTDGTTPVNPVGYIFDEVAGTALTENDIGGARMDSKRAVVLAGGRLDARPARDRLGGGRGQGGRQRGHAARQRHRHREPRHCGGHERRHLRRPGLREDRRQRGLHGRDDEGQPGRVHPRRDAGHGADRERHRRGARRFQARSGADARGRDHEGPARRYLGGGQAFGRRVGCGGPDHRQLGQPDGRRARGHARVRAALGRRGGDHRPAGDRQLGL